MTAASKWPLRSERLFLTGFMGAGKTSVGELLAARFDSAFIDLDHLIETRAGKTIPEIFAESGEAAFRDLEFRSLQDLPRQAVVALGGGAFMQTRLRQHLGRLGTSLYLAWPFSILWQRIAGDPSRPLAQDRNKAHALFNEREPVYQLADFVWLPVGSSEPAPDQVCLEVAQILTDDRTGKDSIGN